VCWAVGLGQYFSGQFDEADRWFTESADLAPNEGQWIVAASSLAYRSLIAGIHGQMLEQHSLADAAVALARERSIDKVHGEVFVALGESLATRGEWYPARANLERAVVVLRSFGQPLVLIHALISKASLLRAIGDREAMKAVVAEAEAILVRCPDPGILRQRLAMLERPVRVARPHQALSDSELKVLRMLGGTLSERDIARELHLSHNTVHTHTKSIYRKLGVSSRVQAVQRARAFGIVRRSAVADDGLSVPTRHRARALLVQHSAQPHEIDLSQA
jgi:LuxR family maltose regulon positive regulatory protein